MKSKEKSPRTVTEAHRVAVGKYFLKINVLTLYILSISSIK